MIRRSLDQMRSDRRGAALLEFAILAPVLILLLMGVGDLLYQSYIQAILEGAVQKAGRDSTLEDSALDQTRIDDRVKADVGMISTTAEFSSKRESYASFGLIKPEPIDDANGNGVLDSHECFDDINGNGTRDLDPARIGQGGADDVTRYTMRVVYTRPFPVAGLLGFSPTLQIEASTLLKNQPYKRQTHDRIQRVCMP